MRKIKKSLLLAAVVGAVAIATSTSTSAFADATITDTISLQNFIGTGIGTGKVSNNITLTGNIGSRVQTSTILLIGAATNTVISGADTYSGFSFKEGTTVTEIRNLNMEHVKNTDDNGGAICNRGTIGTIIGNFTSNSVSKASGDYAGGAIANIGTITTELKGDFTGNSVNITDYGTAMGGALFTKTSKRNYE